MLVRVLNTTLDKGFLEFMKKYVTIVFQEPHSGKSFQEDIDIGQTTVEDLDIGQNYC